MSATRKSGLPICQHITLGLQLLQTRELLMGALTTVQRAYPKNTAVVRRATKALRDLDELRNQLDSASAQENPGDADWATAIYYGSNREVWERDVLPLLRRHRAGGPSCCAGTPEPAR